MCKHMKEAFQWNQSNQDTLVPRKNAFIRGFSSFEGWQYGINSNSVLCIKLGALISGCPVKGAITQLVEVEAIILNFGLVFLNNQFSLVRIFFQRTAEHKESASACAAYLHVQKHIEMDVRHSYQDRDWSEPHARHRGPQRVGLSRQVNALPLSVWGVFC